MNDTKDKIKLTELIGEDARIFKLNGLLYIIYSIHKARFELYYTRLYINYYGYHPYNANHHNNNYDNLHDFNDQYNHSYYHHHHHHHHFYHHNNDTYNNYHFKISKSRHNCYVIKNDIYNLKVTKHINTNLQFHQKNWSPFEFCPVCIYNDDGYINVEQSIPHYGILLFSYTLQPHRVVKPYKTSLSIIDSNSYSNKNKSSINNRRNSSISSNDHNNHHKHYSIHEINDHDFNKYHNYDIGNLFHENNTFITNHNLAFLSTIIRLMSSRIAAYIVAYLPNTLLFFLI